MSKNLVIGAVFGYTVDKIKPFVTSLRQHYQDNVLFVVDSISDEMQEFCNLNNVYTYIPDETSRSASVIISRFEYYLNCLENNFLDVENIMVTDVRDVVFQSNPFANNLAHDIEFFAEPELIGNCKHNGVWYKTVYGDIALDKVKDQYVVCVGTTIGTRSAVMEYFKKIIDEIDRLAAIDKSFWAADTVVHNYLVYDNQFSNFGINHNGEGLVSTMHHSTKLIFNRTGQLLNNDGTVVPVIHQYDRCGPMSTVMLKNALGLSGRRGIKESADYAIANFFEHDLG